VLDVVELLAGSGKDRLRFSDVVRELGLTQATAHAILTTLCDRGWANRGSTPRAHWRTPLGRPRYSLLTNWVMPPRWSSGSAIRW
jgi:hypothetical protein